MEHTFPAPPEQARQRTHLRSVAAAACAAPTRGVRGRQASEALRESAAAQAALLRAENHQLRADTAAKVCCLGRHKRVSPVRSSCTGGQ